MFFVQIISISIVKNFSKTREVFYQKKFDLYVNIYRIPLAFSFLEINRFLLIKK